MFLFAGILINEASEVPKDPNHHCRCTPTNAMIITNDLQCRNLSMTNLLVAGHFTSLGM